jgi:hypothetical protein
MTSDTGGNDEPRWLLEPPSAGQVHIRVAVGEGVELTPEVREALEQLARALGEDDVQGFLLSAFACDAVCEGLVNCVPRDKCNPQYYGPCAWLISCRVEDVRIR